VYDEALRLVSTSDDSTTSTYEYNGDGDRVSQTVDSVTTTYILDIATPLTMVLTETTGSDTILYLHGLGLVAQSDGTTTEYFSQDGLGSVRQMLDSSGDVMMAQTFDPYGNRYAIDGLDETLYGYSGEYTDESGMLYLRARYYNPSQGRFFQPDPSRLESNPYQYSFSNPVRYIDPSGLCGADKLNAKKDDVTGEIVIPLDEEAFSDCIQLVSELESTYDITIYWSERGSLPDAGETGCGTVDPSSYLFSSQDYLLWELDDIESIESALELYKNVIGLNATKAFVKGTVFVRMSGISSAQAGEYFDRSDPNKPSGFDNRPVIVIYSPLAKKGYQTQTKFITHELAHRLDFFWREQGFSGSDNLFDDFQTDIWNDSEENPKTGPTKYANKRDDPWEDLAESITVALFQEEDIEGLRNPFFLNDLSDDREAFVENVFETLREEYPD